MLRTGPFVFPAYAVTGVFAGAFNTFSFYNTALSVCAEQDTVISFTYTSKVLYSVLIAEQFFK